eukprot:32889-Amphidinium_carterae.1
MLVPSMSRGSAGNVGAGGGLVVIGRVVFLFHLELCILGFALFCCHGWSSSTNLVFDDIQWFVF